MKTLLLALLVSSTAYAQTNAELQQQLWQIQQNQEQLEFDMQIQQIRRQQDRMRYRMQYGDAIGTADRLKLERIMREVKRNDGYKWDDEENQ